MRYYPWIGTGEYARRIRYAALTEGECAVVVGFFIECCGTVDRLNCPGSVVAKFREDVTIDDKRSIFQIIVCQNKMHFFQILEAIDSDAAQCVGIR